MEAEVAVAMEEEEGWIHGPGTGAECGESSWQTLQPHSALQGLRECEPLVENRQACVVKQEDRRPKTGVCVVCPCLSPSECWEIYLKNGEPIYDRNRKH